MGQTWPPDRDQWRQASSSKPQEPRNRPQARAAKRQAASLDKAWALGYSGIMSRSLKPEFQEGGSRRQEILDKAVEYIRDPKFGFQGDKHAFLVDKVGLSQTEYLSCLNQASNGAFLKAATGWD